MVKIDKLLALWPFIEIKLIKNKTRGGYDIVALWFPCTRIFFIPCITVDLSISLETSDAFEYILQSQ